MALTRLGIGLAVGAERRVFAESLNSARRRFVSVLRGPSSVQTGVEDWRLAGLARSGAFLQRGAEPLSALPALFTAVRTKKKRGKKERIPPNAEQLSTKATWVQAGTGNSGSQDLRRPSAECEDEGLLRFCRLLPTRLEDLADTAQTPISIAASVRSEISRALRGRKTSRMFAARNKYRVGFCSCAETEDGWGVHFFFPEERQRDSGPCLSVQLRRLLGLTHDDSEEGTFEDGRRKVQGRTFITPLTRTQHEADLPRSPRETRSLRLLGGI